MSDNQKVALHPVLVAVKRIINYLMKNGSASSEELYTKVEVKKRTYYRALKCLLEAEVVIRRDDGFYCWYEYLENVVFTNEVEAEEALKHSRNIARGLGSLIGNEKRFFGNEDYLEDKDYCEPAVMHLKTGYPNFYKKYYQAEMIRKEMLDVEACIKERINRNLHAAHQVTYPEHLVFIILEDIQGILTGRAPAFLEDLRIIGEEVVSIGYALAKKDGFDELRKFILNQEENSENRDSIGILISQRANYYSLRQTFEKEVNMLIKRVENGTPLNGRCPICPKLKIVHLN